MMKRVPVPGVNSCTKACHHNFNRLIAGPFRFQWKLPVQQWTAMINGSTTHDAASMES